MIGDRAYWLYYVLRAACIWKQLDIFRCLSENSVVLLVDHEGSPSLNILCPHFQESVCGCKLEVYYLTTPS